jgi:hypothetical protein
VTSPAKRYKESFMEQMREKHIRIMKDRGRFAEIFGTDLKRFYKDIYIGFDIVAFDNYLQEKDEMYRKANAGELGEDANCSMSDHIKEKYGEEADKMIEGFI